MDAGVQRRAPGADALPTRAGSSPASAPYDDYFRPFFTVGQVAEMLQVQQAFLRRLDQHDVVSPARSEGFQRRYSRHDIDRISEVCSLVGEGMTLAAVKQIVALQAEVASLKAEIAQLRGE